MNAKDLHRKSRILGLSARIRYHRMIMDAETGITDQWKHHARAHIALCRMRADLMTDDERAVIERREGLV